MKWIADFYRARGCEVSGSDLTRGGHRAENVAGADLVVYTSAIDADNPELVAAHELGATVLTRAEALGKIAEEFEYVVAVAGTHGKSTVTGMLASVFAPQKPAVHVGGTMGGTRGGAEGELLIAEACEYRRNFLTLSPDLTVVLNIELDHTDTYKTFSSLIATFAQFASQSRAVVVPDAFEAFLRPRAGGKQILVGPRGGYALIDCRQDKGGSDISVKTPEGIFEARLNVIGKHNAVNAVYAVAAARFCGAEYDEIRAGLAAFGGIDRRLQRVGTCGGLPVFSDYAHHPTEIGAGIAALKSAGFTRPLVAFQPHTYERLSTLLTPFACSLLAADSVIMPVFNARGGARLVTAYDLADKIAALGGHSKAAASFSEAASLVLAAAPSHDAVIVMGAGDNEKVLPLILDKA